MGLGGGWGGEVEWDVLCTMMRGCACSRPFLSFGSKWICFARVDFRA